MKKIIEVQRRDAVSSAIIIHGMTMKLFRRVDQALQPRTPKKSKAQ